MDAPATTVLPASTPLRITQTPVADLAVSEVVGPTILRPGENTSISYRTQNVGNAPVGTTDPVNQPCQHSLA
jgi:hypothetical protein